MTASSLSRLTARHIDFAGAARADLAEIEDRDLKINLEATAGAGAAALPLRAGNAGDFKEIDEAGGVGEPVGFRQRIHFDARDLEIDAPPDGVRLDRDERPRRIGKRRQYVRQSERAAVLQSERADEALALARRALARARKLRRKLDIEGFLARLIELVHGAGLAQLLGELGGGFGGGRHLRERCGKHLGRDRPVVNAARLETDPQGFQSGTQLRLMKTFGGELGARRQRGERENIHDDAALDIELDRRLNAAERECRIGRQARFHFRGFGNAELVIGGLQPFVVQKRDADGAVCRERGAEQVRRTSVRLACHVLAVHFHDFALELWRDDGVHQRHAALRRKCRAAAAGRHEQKPGGEAQAPAKGERPRSKLMDTRRQRMSGHELQPQT